MLHACGEVFWLVMENDRPKENTRCQQVSQLKASRTTNIKNEVAYVWD